MSISPSVFELPALVVDEVDENDLVGGAAPGDSEERGLPVRLVAMPVDLSHVAVLSWRWDIDLQVHGSRNVLQGSRNALSAIRQARQMGVRYLFVDIISIDQKLHGDALVEQVVAFAKLYRTVQVI